MIDADVDFAGRVNEIAAAPCLVRKLLPDGREAMVMPTIYGARITVGPPNADWYAEAW